MYEHMTPCERYAIGGGCDMDCPVLRDGECDTWEEFDKTDFQGDEDLEELLQNYKDEKEYQRVRKIKIEQVKVNEMEVPFKIDEEFIARLLVGFYNGDDSLKNPMRMFKENEALSDRIFGMVDSSLRMPIKQNLFVLDLWLNDFRNGLNYTSQVKSTLKSLFKGTLRSIDFQLIASMKENFYQADLDARDFEWLEIDYDVLKNEDTKSENYAVSRALVTHKDMDMDIMMEIYEITNDESFLPAAAKDVFIF